MKVRIVFAIIAVWCVASLASADAFKCDVCGKPLQGKYFIMDDLSIGGRKSVCEECGSKEDRCFMCGLPVNPAARKLADGRALCARDAKEAIQSEDEAKAVCAEVKNDLNRLLSRYLTMPGENIVVSIVDKFHLESLFKSPGYERTCVSIFGATQSQPLPGNKFVHSVSILSDLKRSRLMAVCAHEFTHAWMGENVKPERKALLAPDTVEGFCELIAYKYMESRHETYEMQVIRKSDYTRGQILALIEAEKRYGFNTVMEWIKSGEDNHLDLNNLDRVRAIQSGPRALSAVPLAVSIPAVAPVAITAPTAPATLTLKGISGTSQRRFALINDGTFEVSERGKVHLGGRTVLIRCLEIRSDSVVVQAEGSSEKQELFLGGH